MIIGQNKKLCARDLNGRMGERQLIVSYLQNLQLLPAELDPQLNAQARSKIFPRPHKSIPKTWLSSSWLPG